MKQYLIDTFRYNREANLKLLDAIKQMPDFEEGIRLFSHMIHAQNIWLGRVVKEEEVKGLTWPGPTLPVEELEGRWADSTDKWLRYVEGKSEAELNEYIVFSRFGDSRRMQVKVIDIMLQINYHSIHHRAQVQRLIRELGGKPPATDYILTKMTEVRE